MSAKKILILTASIGSGHIKAAEAVARELASQDPEAQIAAVDFMARSTAWGHWLIKRVYLEMLRFVPNLYDVFYKVSGGEAGGSLAQKSVACFMLPVFARLYKKYTPDIVICTHPFPAAAASLWKEQNNSSLPLAVVMTDYSLHQVWLCPRVDSYFMATDSMRQAMERQGFADKELQVTGIPVSSQLQQLPDKDSMRQELGVDRKDKVILLMGGGLGLGGIEHTLEALETIEETLTLLVITGRNADLLNRASAFAETSHHRLHIWGYTDEAHKLMRVSDMLITKPGALTISEAFVLGLPMLLHDPIPGPETENAVYATKNGAALWLHPGEKLAPAVLEMLNDDTLARMGSQALACAKPQASSQIAAALLRM